MQEQKTGEWIIDTNKPSHAIQLLNAATAGTVDVSLLCVPIFQLFPPNLLFPNVDYDKSCCVYRIFSEELETVIWKALDKFSEDIQHQCRVMTFHESKFDMAEKTRRSEAQRTTYRIDTRLYQSLPELKAQVHFLNPGAESANIQMQKKIVFGTIPPNDTKAIDACLKRYDVYHKTPYKFCFRGSLPVSIMQADLPSMYDNRQFLVVAPKTNGLRLFLVATTMFQEPLLVFMDRSLKLYLIPLDIPHVWYQGTILDGELVSLKSGKYAFIVYDAWQINGVPVAQESYLNRLQIAHLLIEQREIGLKATQDVFELRVKPVYSVSQVPDVLMQELSRMDHLLDGLIITAVEPSAPLGRAAGKIYKYKVGHDNTIDCLVQHKQNRALHLLSIVKGDEYALWAVIDDLKITEKKELKTVCDSLGVNNIQSWEALCATLHDKVVECAFDATSSHWHIKSIREKNDANLLSTAIKTFQNIQEGLTLNQIFPAEYVTWSRDQRDKLIEWETQFLHKYNSNWTIVPQLSQFTKNESNNKKQTVPPMSPVPLRGLKVLEF